jgi:acyl carrier protein
MTRDSIDRVVATEWCALLGTTDVTDEDDFFASGGNSVQAADLIARIEQRFGLDFPLEALFLDGTFGTVRDACVAALESKTAAP